MLARRASRPLARHARNLVVVGASVLVLTASTLPALAEPSPEELRAADQRVSAERARLASLTERAERAAEAYNGARVLAERATGRSEEAAANAAASQRAYDAARAQATAAEQASRKATVRAETAHAQQLAAEADADAAQLQLDQIAVSAYRADGSLSMVSALLSASSPTQLVEMRDLMNHVGNYQDHVIDVAREARERAQVAAVTATRARAAAAAAVEAAATAVVRAEATHSTAVGAQQEADASAAVAVQAEREARRARARALTLVAQAEASVKSAVRSQKSLQEAAAQARQEASGYRSGPAPSEAARIAIHWAFEEIGVPYAWGGGDENGPSEGFAQGAGTVGFDCSGLTLFIYHKAGIRLEHWTGSQWHAGKRITRRGDLQPGDLMFFAHDTSNDNTIHHVSIYIGNGKMIEAPYTGEVVRVSSADRSDFIGATRPWA